LVLRQTVLVIETTRRMALGIADAPGFEGFRVVTAGR
jgi:hypothetical protein